jgi:hypothetical protein
MKRGQKRTKLQRAADLCEVETLALKGISRSEIITTLAEKRGYKISRSQLGYDLAKLKADWKARAVSAFADEKAESLAELKLLRSEAWRAFENSKRDPKFIAAILSILERRAKLLGLDGPAKLELSGPNGGPIESANVEAFDATTSREILRRHLERMNQRPGVTPEKAETNVTTTTTVIEEAAAHE